MKYKHIVFDVDGTLLDSEVKVLSTLRQSILDFGGRDYSLEELSFAMGMAPDTILYRLGFSNVEPMIRRWEQHLIHYAEGPRFYDGMVDTLFKLSDQGVTIGIATSRIYEEFLTDFEKLPVFNRLGHAVCGDHVKNRKPAPDVLLRYLELSGAKKEEVLFVGDTSFDMEAAKAAGIDFALAGWGTKLPKDSDCAYYFDQPSDLLAI